MVFEFYIFFETDIFEAFAQFYLHLLHDTVFSCSFRTISHFHIFYTYFPEVMGNIQLQVNLPQ